MAKVYVTQYDYQADLKVYKVQNDYQAKWQTSNPFISRLG